MHSVIRPHDLLWGMTHDQLPADAPAWAATVLAAGLPVVVRRAPVRAGAIPVGLRGSSRAERYGCWMPLRAVVARMVPEALPAQAVAGELPALRALSQVRPLLDGLGLAWGITGGVGYQLATGQPVLHPDSDLDLLLRCAQPIDRARAARLLARLELLPCRVDLQLETPAGGVALREWASGARQVLLKAADGPQLVNDPWGRAAA